MPETFVVKTFSSFYQQQRTPNTEAFHLRDRLIRAGFSVHIDEQRDLEAVHFSVVANADEKARIEKFLESGEEISPFPHLPNLLKETIVSNCDIGGNLQDLCDEFRYAGLLAHEWEGEVISSESDSTVRFWGNDEALEKWETYELEGDECCA